MQKIHTSTNIARSIAEIFGGFAIISLLFLGATVMNSNVENQTPELSDIKREINKREDYPEAQTLVQSGHPVVSALGKHEELYKGEIGTHIMIFTGMPTDEYDAIPMARDMAVQLKEIHNQNLVPIVIVEPDSNWGLIDFNEFQTGLYAKGIRRYFEILKQEGIREDMVGIWVPFPEANLPYWNHTGATPADYADAVNLYHGQFKAIYPNGEASVLLNSQTYEPTDYLWDNGQFISLKPYVETLDSNLIDSFGIQGFPWAPRNNQSATPIDDAGVFIDTALVNEAAEIIGVNKIWFNTGTFSAKYTNNAQQETNIDTTTRRNIAQTIIKEVQEIDRNKYEVIVNIFAEDKSKTAEATDWSYLENEYNSSEHQYILFEMINTFQQMGVGIAVFDK